MAFWRPFSGFFAFILMTALWDWDQEQDQEQLGSISIFEVYDIEDIKDVELGLIDIFLLSKA